MFIDWLKKIFDIIFGKTRPPAISTPAPAPVAASPAQPPALPFPEEPPDYTSTQANVDLNAVFDSWMARYQVPPAHRDHWRNSIVIEVYDTYPDWMSRQWPGLDLNAPALTWDGADGKRHLAIKPAWLNAGVICHEQCHNSYALLTEDRKQAFESVYGSLRNDACIDLLYAQKDAMMNALDDRGRHVEGHAEIGRFIGQYMPAELKPFYPRLFQA